MDSSFLESRLQPDSFFGASGGQRVDTNEGTPTGSSMVYSPSQLDAAGDVDPVAEADVYLAYGRDLQAEEILKEALRINPQRVAIHVKLLEIYAKRRDAKAFEQVASEAYSLTHGEGAEWDHICELGQELDPVEPDVPAGRPAHRRGACRGSSGRGGRTGEPGVPGHQQARPLRPTRDRRASSISTWTWTSRSATTRAVAHARRPRRRKAGRPPEAAAARWISTSPAAGHATDPSWTHPTSRCPTTA